MTLISGILLLYCFLYGCCLQSFNTKIFVLFLLQLIFWLLILTLVLFAVFYAEGLINFQDGTWLNLCVLCILMCCAQMRHCS